MVSVLRAGRRHLPPPVTRRLQRWRAAATHLLAGAELHEASAVAARQVVALREELKGDLERLLQDLLQRQDAVLASYDRRVAAAVNRLLDLEARLEAGGDDVSRVDTNAVLATHQRSRPPGLQVRLGAGPGDDDRRARVDARLARRIELLRSHPPVLDLGCGHGVVLVALEAAGVAASGVDADPVAVAALRERGLDARPGDVHAEMAALPPASVGSVTVIGLVEHLDLGDVDRLLRGAQRIVQPGGVLLVDTTYPTTAASIADFWRDPSRVRPYDPSALRRLAEGAGFEAVEVCPHPPTDEDYELLAHRP